jgi:hypothetical protein
MAAIAEGRHICHIYADSRRGNISARILMYLGLSDELKVKHMPVKEKQTLLSEMSRAESNLNQILTSMQKGRGQTPWGMKVRYKKLIKTVPNTGRKNEL